MNSYTEGNVIRLSVQFVDASNVAADPTSVVLRVQDPADATSVYTYGQITGPTRTGAGAFALDITPALVGTWSYRWEATGAVVAAVEGTFRVRSSVFVS